MEGGYLSHNVRRTDLGEPTKGEWSLKIDAGDLHTINFHYPTAPAAEDYEGMANTTPRVKLEFSARGPTDTRRPVPMRRKIFQISSRIRIPQ
ncbi:hypothetical protein X769_13970 [Mesorhizobium sp. LSJC268A00]|nr:hypothetical protein X769_13970 [Mesorhizobium sp. LSJC268A00]